MHNWNLAVATQIMEREMDKALGKPKTNKEVTVWGEYANGG